jgi:hypothetical protein
VFLWRASQNGARLNARHVWEHAPKAGYASLARPQKRWYTEFSPNHRCIRRGAERVKYYLERRTQAFLASRPNRFQYVLTPKHGSWLNIVETLFGKMARTFSPTYPGAILGGTPNPHPSGRCGNQCRSRRSSVEEVRGSDHRIVCIWFSETIYCWCDSSSPP